MINLIVTAISTRIASTNDAIKVYFETKKTETLALEKLLYSILTIWHLHIIITVSATLFGLYLIGQYLLPIMALVGFFYLQFGQRPQPRQIRPLEQYLQIRDFIYEPIRLISESLPVFKPQTIEDIVNKPEFLVNNGHILYIFKLLKNVNEELGPEDTDFIKKVLQARINQRLDEHENLFSYHTWYDDTRVITVNDVTDVGTHYQISIIFVDNDTAYDYVKRRHNPTASTKEKNFYDEVF